MHVESPPGNDGRHGTGAPAPPAVNSGPSTERTPHASHTSTRSQRQNPAQRESPLLHLISAATALPPRRVLPRPAHARPAATQDFGGASPAGQAAPTPQPLRLRNSNQPHREASLVTDARLGMTRKREQERKTVRRHAISAPSFKVLKCFQGYEPDPIRPMGQMSLPSLC